MMKYVTITANTYSEAVKKAKAQYGDAIRIHSRRDVVKRGGFLGLGKRSSVQLLCYLAESSAPENEMAVVKRQSGGPRTSIQDALEAFIAHSNSLLELNDFSPKFNEAVMRRVREALVERNLTELSFEKFELMLIDAIVSLLLIDHVAHLHPPRIFVILGPTGIGKTTTIAKIAAMYAQQMEGDIRIITIDSFRLGAFEQINAFAQQLHVIAERVTNEEDFYRALEQASKSRLILVDTIGKSPRDNELAVQMKTLLSVLDRNESRFYLAVSPMMKEKDLKKVVDQYQSFDLSGLVVTKTDESETIGTVISLSYETKLPLLFITDGQRIPTDIHKASAASMLSLLKGFSVDFTDLWHNQIEVSFSEKD